MRRIARVDRVVEEGETAGALTLRGSDPARGLLPAPPLQGAEQARRDRGHTDQAGTGVGADDRPELGDDLGPVAVDLAPAPGDPLGELRRLYVLDEEDVRPGVVLLLQLAHEPVDRAALRAHALDGRDLAVDGEDRLDLQRGPEERLRGADPPAPAQVLERVDR